MSISASGNAQHNRFLSSHPNIPGIAQALTYSAALTSTWTGVRIAGLNITDCLLIGATVFVLLAAARNGHKLPIYPWAVLPPVTLLVIALIGSLIRGDPLTSRRTMSDWVVGATVGSDYSGALPLVLRMALSITCVSIVVAGVTDRPGRYNFVRTLMFTWAVGAALSGAFSVVDKALGNSIELPFLAHYYSETRVNGLTHHPNALGQTITLTLPLLIYMVGAFRGWAKVSMAVLLPLSMYAVFLTGSRGGLLGGTILALATFAYLMTSGKRVSVPLVSLLLLLVPLAIVMLPEILRRTRFFDKSGEISSSRRGEKFQIGVDLFSANPFFGSGVGSYFSEVAPLNILISGGVVFFLVFYGCLAYPVFKRLSLPHGTFASILVISAIGVLGYGLLNNGIVERYLYWPFAALFALSLGFRDRTATDRAS